MAAERASRAKRALTLKTASFGLPLGGCEDLRVDFASAGAAGRVRGVGDASEFDVTHGDDVDVDVDAGIFCSISGRHFSLKLGRDKASQAVAVVHILLLRIQI